MRWWDNSQVMICTVKGQTKTRTLAQRDHHQGRFKGGISKSSGKDRSCSGRAVSGAWLGRQKLRWLQGSKNRLRSKRSWSSTTSDMVSSPTPSQLAELSKLLPHSTSHWKQQMALEKQEIQDLALSLSGTSCFHLWSRGNKHLCYFKALQCFELLLTEKTVGTVMICYVIISGTAQAFLSQIYSSFTDHSFYFLCYNWRSCWLTCWI